MGRLAPGPKSGAVCRQHGKPTLFSLQRGQEGCVDWMLCSCQNALFLFGCFVTVRSCDCNPIMKQIQKQQPAAVQESVAVDTQAITLPV